MPRFHHAVAGTVVILAISDCGPSRAYLFDSVADTVHDRIGIRPEWHSEWRRSPAAEKRLRALLAEPMTADSAAAIAVLASPHLQAAYTELAMIGGTIAQARALPNPALTAEFRFPLDGADSAQVELGAVESLTGLLTLIPRTQAATDGLHAARRSAVAQTVAVAASARVAFYAATAASQLLALRRTIAAAAGASAELAARLHDAGNITTLDWTRETLFGEEAQLALRSAELNAIDARERLNAVLGLSGKDSAWQLPQRLPDATETLASQNDLEQTAITNSLDLEAMRWRLEAAGRKIGLARLESVLPNLGIGVSVKKEVDWSAGPMITLGLPLFDWGQGRQRTAWAEVERLRHEYAAIAADIRAAARAALARVTTTHANVALMKQRVLPLRERLLDESIKQYNAMNLNAFELLVVRREQIEAEARYVAALRDYWMAQVEVDQLRAGSLPRGNSAGSSEQTRAERE